MKKLVIKIFYNLNKLIQHNYQYFFVSIINDYNLFINILPNFKLS